MNVDTIVDNDVNKRGGNIHGHPVKYFGELSDWSNRFVIITCGAYMDIANQLEDVGLHRNTDFIFDIDF